MFQLSEKAKKEVDRLIEKRRNRYSGIVEILTNGSTKFGVGSRVWQLQNIWGDYFETPKKGIVIAVYSWINSEMGDYPQQYIVEFDDGKIEDGFLPNMLVPEKQDYKNFMKDKIEFDDKLESNEK